MNEIIVKLTKGSANFKTSLNKRRTNAQGKFIHWAIRTGVTYGTITVESRRHMLDLLTTCERFCQC